MTTTLLVVAQNEIEGMRAIMPKVDPQWCEQILVVDGRSTDGTAEYARAMGYDVHVQREPGLRAAYREAWPLVRSEWVLTFSPDGNSPPEYIPQLIAKAAEGHDMVIASRYLDGTGSEDDDAITAFGNWLFTSVINGLYRWHYTDAMTIYRIYRKEMFYALALDQDRTYRAFERMFFTRLGVEPILSARVARRGLRTADIACPEPPRIGGERKLQVVRWGLGYMTQVVCERFRKSDFRIS